MHPLLELKHVTAGYAKDIDIIRDVTMVVQERDVVGLLGLNGAGKSTLMKVILGFLSPREGRVLFHGDDITGTAPHAMIDRGVWLIPQESSLFPHLSVEDNLRLPLEHLRRKARTPDRREQRERMSELCELFPAIGQRLRSSVGNLSGGQQKMVEFGKAFLIRPRLCLIDEPSVGVAPIIAEQIYGFIEVFGARGMTILLIDHNVRKVLRIARHVYVLTLGEVSASGPREQFETSLHAHAREWLGLREDEQSPERHASE